MGGDISTRIVLKKMGTIHGNFRRPHNAQTKLKTAAQLPQKIPPPNFRQKTAAQTPQRQQHTLLPDLTVTDWL